MQIDLRDIDYFLACAMHGRVALLLSTLLREQPGLRLKIRMGQPDRLMSKAVREGDLDVAMMPIYEAVSSMLALLTQRETPSTVI